MATFDENGNMEYAALMARGRDSERTWQICWTASGLVAGVMMSWAIAARNPGLMLPAIVAVAYGFYAMIHGRRQTRLIAGYVEEFFEQPTSGPQWFTRLGHLQTLPSFNPTSDWMMTFLCNAVVICAIGFAWLFSSVGPRGELMAGIVTGCGVVFAFHSISETSQLRRSDYATFWRQLGAPSQPRHEQRLAVR